MKKLFTPVLALWLVSGALAQSPEKMSYQAVIRNSSNQLVTNQVVGIRLSILQGTETGTAVYIETQTPMTNSNGLITLEIGGGNALSGTISTIDWTNGPYFLKTETDPTGGVDYTITGTSQLLSVPYALYAKTAENVNGGISETDPLFTTSPANGITSSDINDWKTAFNWGNHSGLYRISSWVPVWSDITGKPVFNTVATSGSYNDLTNKPTLFSGSFNDLTNKPTTLGGYGITDAMISSHAANGITSTNITNWNAAFGWGNHAGLYRPISYMPSWSEITGKPTFATVATSGNYADLSNKPVLFDGTWGSLSGKPTFATVATSGSYNDLTNKPTVVSSQWTTNASNIYYSSGNVGIGVTSPMYKLEIYDGSFSYLRFLNSTSGSTNTDGFVVGTTSSGSPVWIWNYENSNMHFATKNMNRLIIDANGQVNIMGLLNINDDVSWGAALQVNNAQALWWNGTYFSWGYDALFNYFASPITIGNVTEPTGYSLWVQGNAWSTGAFLSSDARYKKNITAIDNVLDKIMKIRGTRFEFRIDEFKDYQFAEGPQYGFIAQELEDVFPELVNNDCNDYKSVNYNGMVPVLLEALKEQQEIINNLKAENDQLRSKQKNLDDRLLKMETLMNLTSHK